MHTGNYFDVKVGDRIYGVENNPVYYTEHEFLVTEISAKSFAINEKNPIGMVVYGEDLNCSKDSEDAIFAITPDNFAGIRDRQEFKNKIKELYLVTHDVSLATHTNVSARINNHSIDCFFYDTGKLIENVEALHKYHDKLEIAANFDNYVINTITGAVWNYAAYGVSRDDALKFEWNVDQAILREENKDVDDIPLD